MLAAYAILLAAIVAAIVALLDVPFAAGFAALSVLCCVLFAGKTLMAFRYYGM